MVLTRSSAHSSRPFDVIVWGCTGFTGQLVCEYLHGKHCDLKWAIAGRNYQQMVSLKERLKLSDGVEILVGSIDDPQSLLDITTKTKVILSTAGPYAKIGTPIVQAAVDGNCHYCDITGEVPWVRKVVDQFSPEAVLKRLKIVQCCGFDCIPCDLGTQMIVDEAKRNGFNTILEARYLSGDSLGGASGGTIASVFNIFDSLPLTELTKLSNPYVLNPRDPKTSEPLLPVPKGSDAYSRACDNMVLGYDRVARAWTSPYLMQGIDTRIVNRSNAVSNFSYGKGFIYSERQVHRGLLPALLTTVALAMFQLLILVPVTRSLLKRVLPKPGQGPSQDMLDNGYFHATMWCRAANDSGEERVFWGKVSAVRGDPGYRQTAKMVSESAVCLAQDFEQLNDAVGVLTPSTAMGHILRQRLTRAGVVFDLTV